MLSYKRNSSGCGTDKQLNAVNAADQASANQEQIKLEPDKRLELTGYATHGGQ